MSILTTLVHSPLNTANGTSNCLSLRNFSDSLTRPNDVDTYCITDLAVTIPYAGHAIIIVCVSEDGVGIDGVMLPCPPVHNDIVTPSH